MTENDIATRIVDAAFRTHPTLGPGLLESACEAVMAEEWTCRGLQVCRQQGIPSNHGSVHLEAGFRADLIVEGNVIVETKAVEAIAGVHRKLLLAYLKPADRRLGLPINFGVDLIKDGIMRMVNRLDPEGSFSQRR